MTFITIKGCLLCIWEICLQHVRVRRKHLQVIQIHNYEEELLGCEWFRHKRSLIFTVYQFILKGNWGVYRHHFLSYIVESG